MPLEIILFGGLIVAAALILSVRFIIKAAKKRRRHTHRCHGKLAEIRKDELLLVRPSHGRLIIPTYIAKVETLRSHNVLEFRISRQWLGKLKEGDIGTFVYRHGSLLTFSPDTIEESEAKAARRSDRRPVDAD